MFLINYILLQTYVVIYIISSVTRLEHVKSYRTENILILVVVYIDKDLDSQVF